MTFEENIHFNRGLDKLIEDAITFRDFSVEKDNFKDLKKFVESGMPDNKSELDKISQTIHEWLSFIQSNTNIALMKWSYLIKNAKEKTLRDRDLYILKFLKNLEEKIIDGDLTFSEYVKKNWCPWSYYQDHFFFWFLNRFDIVKARGVFKTHIFQQLIHIPVFILTVATTILFLVKGWTTGCCWLTGASLIFVWFLLGWPVSGLKPGYYLQTLIPRFAVTIAIGYLFLFSAGGLVKVIYQIDMDIWGQIGIVIALVFSIWLFLIQNIQKRVQPRLDLWKAIIRSSNLMILAITYSAVGLYIIKPILYSESYLSTINISYIHTDRVGYLLITAALALAIGVALQLVWEDKPVTEPL